ncbi:MAG: TlpA family protein disulfide reductase [Candidatus Nanopelagicales bacterium]
MTRRTIAAVLATAAAGLLAACGSDGSPAPGAGANGAAGTAAAEPSAARSDAPPMGPSLPDVSVQDLAGGTLSVADLADGDKPVLVWFWAPHCPYCNAEAKDVEKFAKAHRDAVRVVGLGTQDSVEEAHAFVREHGLNTPQMLYDASFASWQQLGIRGQPAAMLFDRDGVARGQWFGPFDEQQVLDIAARI